MTWAQVWLYYEAYYKHLNKEEYDSNEEVEDKTSTLYPGMPGVKTANGVRSYGK